MRLKFRQGILGFFVVLALITTSSISGELLHGPDRGQVNIASSKGSIIVYRDNSVTTKNVPVVFINGKVTASLLPGEYIQTRVCNRTIKLRIATRGDRVTKGRSKNINITKASITYVKLVKTQNQTFSPLVVDEIQGKKALQNIQRTSNVINRYIPKMVLGTDNLFAFNSAKLLPSSRTTMNKLVADINMCPSQVKHIKIIGHTDRIGSKAANEKLSLRRAQSVADYLAAHGVKIPMEVEGHGSREPLTSNCRGNYSRKLIQCLQADRRVVVEY